MQLRRLVLWVDGWAEIEDLRAEFPTVELGVAAGAVPRGQNVIRAADWWGPAALGLELDRRMEGPLGESGPESIVAVAGTPEEGGRLALQLLTRYQHRVARRNASSKGAIFDQVLGRHRRLHDLSHVFVRADYIHALDVWQWVLRLEPSASLPLQLAALFHDVERPIVEPVSRSEPVGPSFQSSKDAHARTSAHLARVWLANLSIDPEVLHAAEHLIEGHERQATTDEQAVLNQADALSFISRGTDVCPASALGWRLRRALSRLRGGGASRLNQLRATPEVHRLIEAYVPSAVAEPELQLAAASEG